MCLRYWERERVWVLSLFWPRSKREREREMGGKERERDSVEVVRPCQEEDLVCMSEWAHKEEEWNKLSTFRRKKTFSEEKKKKTKIKFDSKFAHQPWKTGQMRSKGGMVGGSAGSGVRGLKRDTCVWKRVHLDERERCRRREQTGDGRSKRRLTFIGSDVKIVVDCGHGGNRLSVIFQLMEIY